MVSLPAAGDWAEDDLFFAAKTILCFYAFPSFLYDNTSLTEPAQRRLVQLSQNPRFSKENRSLG